MRRSITYIVCGLTILFLSCERLDIKRVDPNVTNITPSAAVPGTTIVMTGEHFITESVVTFNGIPAEVSNATKTRMEVTIPLETEPGIADVMVKAEGAPHGLQYEVLTPFEELQGHPRGASQGTGFVIDDEIYFGTGGATGNQTFYRYDTRSNQWEQVTDELTIPSRSTAFGFSLGGKGYVFAGRDFNVPADESYLRDLWEFDPATAAFTRKADYPLNRIFEGPAVFTIGADAYFCSGAQEDDPTAPSLISTIVYKYSQVEDEWTRMNDFPGLKRAKTIGFSINGKGYLVQGIDRNTDNLLNDCWEYDPTSDTWSEVSAPNPAANLSGGTGFSFNGKGYIGLGRTNGGQFESQFWRYDPVEDRWDEFLSFPGELREDAISFVAGDAAYIMNGRSQSSEQLNELWRFTPETQ